MKALYGRGILVDLEVRDASEYGFDTFQLNQIHSGTDIDDIIGEEVGNIDGWFNAGGPYNLILPIQFWGDPYACPNYTSASAASGQVNIIDREEWYDNTAHAFYTDLKIRIEEVEELVGCRLVGIRWNHEIAPNLFKEGPRWHDHALENHETEYNSVYENSNGEELWEQWREAVPSIGSKNAYDGTNLPQIWAQFHPEVPRLYRRFVDYQVNLQKTMIEILRSKIASVNSDLKFIVYTPQQGPNSVYAKEEYTLDLDGVGSPANPVWEISAWDSGSQAGNKSLIDNWAGQAGGNDYYFVMQQGSSLSTESVVSYIENLQNPGVTNQPDHFAFWSKWRRLQDPDALSEQRQYMNKVKEALG